MDGQTRRATRLTSLIVLLSGERACACTNATNTAPSSAASRGMEAVDEPLGLATSQDCGWGGCAGDVYVDAGCSGSGW